jgi:hypothetical protein
MADLVYFRCVKDGRKLRVRVISRGYNPDANCQFPRAIRAEGKRYSAPRSCLKFARGPAGKFFYRVRKAGIKVLGSNESVNAVNNLAEHLEDVKISVEKVYETESDECLVCLDRDYDVVIVPCGHYCMCAPCANQLEVSTGKCPLCRGGIERVVTRDMIQT